jgi:hypothetical protein
MKVIARLIIGAVIAGVMAAVTACGGGTASASPPSPASLAHRLGCSLAPYADVNQQDAYDTVAYDSLTAPGDPSSPCEVGDGSASDVITFASQAKETDWLHLNDLAQSAGEFGSGYVALVEGPLWVVTSGSGVADNGIVAKLAPIGGREVTTF